MKRFSSTATWYAAVLALGALLVPSLIAGAQELIRSEEMWPIALLAAGVWLGLHRTVRLGKGDYHSVYTLDDAPTFAIIFLFSTPVATLTVTALRFCYESVRLA